MAEDIPQAAKRIGGLMLKAIRNAFGLLRKRDRRILASLMVLQSMLSLLDLAGVAMLGVVAALSAQSITGVRAPAVDKLMNGLGIDPGETLGVSLWLAGIAGVLLISKSVSNLIVTRQAFKFLAKKQAETSSKLARVFLSRPLLQVQERSSQEVAYALTKGVNAATIGVLGSTVIIVSELTLVLVLTVALAFVDVWVMAFTLIFFSVLGFALHRALSGWASRLGEQTTSAEISSLAAVQEALSTYRETTVNGRRSLFVHRFQELRWRAAEVQADLQIMNQFSKYAFEVALIIGGALLVGSQLAGRDVTAAVAVIAVFLTAASRMMPSLLRLQTASLDIRVAREFSMPTFELVRELNELLDVPALSDGSAEETKRRLLSGIRAQHSGFDATIHVERICVSYPSASQPAISEVSLHIPAGTTVGIVGASGAGKSTLADLLLGVLDPDSGSVSIGEFMPIDAAHEFPGAIAYVPQEVSVVSGTVRANVAMGFDASPEIDDLVIESLKRAHLYELLEQDRLGLDTLVGEHGVELSGGQKQRLGLARALFSRPRLLVLDEATSALDAATENLISQALNELAPEVTMVIVAHRLATIRDCEQVVFLVGGRVEAVGKFDDVRSSSEAFDRQARLLGM